MRKIGKKRREEQSAAGQVAAISVSGASPRSVVGQRHPVGVRVRAG